MVQTLDPSTGGVATAVLLLSKALEARGHHVEVVALDEPDAAWLAGSKLRVHALCEGRTSYRYSAALLPWLRQHRRNYDCAIVNGLWQYQSFAAWRAFAGTSVPYYVFPHGMLDPWFKRTFPLKHAKKWLYWPWADYRALRDAGAVIFTSEEERLLARKSFWLYRAKERISPLGVEKPAGLTSAARETFLSKFPAARETRILLFLGRLHPKKGCDLLIEALARISIADAKLSLVFAGPDQVGWAEQLRTRAAELKLDLPVIFTGMLEGELKQGAFEAADAFVLPSHQENFGLSVVEALAAGVPVLISKRVNIWREVEADQAGYVDEDNLAGTTRLLETWINAPADARERMRARTRQCFASRFEIGRAAESLLRVLEETREAA
jgi:glycosyltransferase involved in cell wall biosynthesis